MSSAFGTGRVAYPGLRAFGREEFDLFFGRESCVDEMVDTLGRTCFLAVLGTSGSGKSSLVRTGLLNALELGFLASAGSTWRIAELRPRGHPIRSLAIALLGLQGVEKPDEAEIEILSAFLRRGPRSLVEWASGGHLPQRANLMVLVDQFEELFRYEDYSGREEAEAFVGLLVTAARANAPIYIAITMRSEYLGACTLIEGLPEVINRGLYLTPRMSRDECRQAIVGPAEVCGFRIEDRLVNKLLNDLTDFAPWEAGGGHDQQRRLGRRADQLPLMQHVLNLLWQKARVRSETDIVLTLADYEAAGGLGGALDRHADDIAATVPPEYAEAIDPVFRSLVTGRTVADAVRRPTRFGDLVELAGGSRDAVAAVVDAFRAQGVNFLTPGQPDPIDDDSFIDISHESLIRQWRRLSRCLDEEAHSADAWHQLLSRSERYKAGAGGLLTGLDLDNLVDWWERTKPTAAWANRYGNNFEEAGKYLRDSQFAEADLKRREEEEERKLIAAEEAASSGRRFKRLAVALAAALIVAFAATGAAFYLWREANADALAADIARAEAEEAKLEADNQRAIAETARAEAEEQRIIAEAEAEAAETARAEAEEQRIIAEAARLEAERARAAAETARQEAIAARQQADQIIDTSIAYFAKSLGDEVASIHSDPNLAPELSYAGGLLSRLAADTQAEGASAADAGFMDVLRPTFVVQDALTSAYVPAMGSGPSDVTWTDPPGGPGLVAVMDLTGKKLRITDRTGRIVALYEIPASFWGALADTPFAAVRGGDGAPIAVIADTAGDIWIGSGGLGPLQVVGNGANEFGQIDDLSFDPASGKIAIAYSVETVTGERRGDRGQARLGSLLNVAVIENNVGGWRIVGSSRLPRGPLGSESGPVRLAGALGDLIFAVAEGAVVAIDVEASSASAIDMPVPVVDAGMTEDGRFLLAGALRNADGQCSDASGTQGFLEPWFRRDPEAPVKVVADADTGDATADQAETRAAPDVPDAACLILVDIGSGDPLWQGTASAARFDSLRGVAGVEAVEFVEGPTANDLRVRRIFQAPEGWTDSAIDFDQNDWGLTGFSETYAAVAATDAAFPPALTPDLVDRRIKDGILRRIASPPPGGRIVASRIAGDEVQIARIPAGADPFGGETALEVLVYRPEAGQYVRDDRIDTNGAACLASGQDGSCRFDAAAFSPNGDWLLLVSSGNHVFVGRSGMLGGWQTTIPEETGAAAIPQDGRATRSQTLQGGDKGGPVEKAEGVGTEVLPEDVGKGTGVGGGAGPGAFLASVLPLDAEGRSFVGRSGLDGGLWRVVRLGGTGGSGSSRTSVTPIDLPRQIAAGMTGIATDPERSTIYVWGPRIGLRMISGESSGMAEAAFEFDSPLADVAPLPSGGVVVATTDGDVIVVPPDRFRLSGSGSAGNAAVESPASVDTGLGRFGAMDVWAGSDRVVVSAGTPTPEGVDNAPAAAPAPDDETDRARLRAVGFALDGDGALQLTFIAPWERIDGQLANGEAVSLSTGEVLGEPPPLPDDETLLALTIMREQQHTQETPEFEIGFDMLHMRVAGDAEDGVRVSSCEWILTTAVRMGGDLQQNIGEDVRRACDEPAATAPVVNAIFDDRNDQRTSALLRYAPANPLALAVLISNLRQVAPAAAEVLASSYRAAQYDQWESALAAIAEGGPLPLATAGADAAVFDPFAHWVLAMEGERTGGNAETLAESLFHYAYAERLFRTARFRTPEQIVKRRIALARSLSDDVVYGVFQRLQASPVNPDDASSGQELVSVPLHDIRQWLVEIGGSDPEAAKRLDVLVAPVEEMMGDELASTDPEAAAGHYWKAISLVASAGESLSQRPGVLGRIDKVQELGGKLAAAGSSMALADTSGAVLGIIDAALTQPVRRDIDPPELRPAIASAFEDLAEAGAEGYDLSRFRDLGLRFLDFDWESRFQSINQVGAERFYRELTAAEAFLTAALATASDEDRLHWLALRGRMRFWLSTIDGESVPVDGAVLRDWLDGALADYDAAGGPEKLGLWDATIVGGANSRMIELVGSEAEVAGYVAKASAAFRHAIDRHGDPNGVIGGDGKPEDFLDLDQYRRRLAYDGYVLALERAIIWLRGDRFLSGVEAQPGDPDYNRGRLADIGYAALSYARQREALRAEAEVNGLFEKNSTWSLDTFGDFYWGSTVAQMGALLRIEDGVNGSPNLCDRLAAHPYDVTRPTAAVDYDALDVDAVLDACDDGAARSLYHQARALSKAATVSPDEILRLLLPSAREQLPIAYNNISILVSDAGGTPEEAQALVSTFSELSLITAYPQIAVLLREEQKSAERAETFEWLARKAAALGVPEAYLDIAELTPDVLTRALNYTIARDLYAEAGRTADAEAMQAKLDAVNLSATNVSSLAAQAANRARVTPRLLDDALIKRIEDLLWDARSQASLR